MVDSTVRLPQNTSGYYIQLLEQVETARPNLPPGSEEGLMAGASDGCFYRRCGIPKICFAGLCPLKRRIFLTFAAILLENFKLNINTT